jgi:hypothetical protein
MQIGFHAAQRRDRGRGNFMGIEAMGVHGPLSALT